MKAPNGLAGKPSPAHIVWVAGEEGDGSRSKRFHAAELRGWCAKYDVDYERCTRVDRERADEQRTQYRCVFEWGEREGETLSLGGDTWEVGGGTVAESFLEIDVEGAARVRRNGAERVLDVAELAHRGPALLVREWGTEDVLVLDARQVGD